MKEFIKQFITNKGYMSVLDGLVKTIEIAVLGLIIGIIIGTLIGIVRVMPKYKRLPRVLDKICICYLELFRGTPIVVQLLIGYWVLLPALGITVNSGVPVAIIVFGLNSGAYVSEIMPKGQVAPIEYCSENIRDIIISARKQSLIINLERDLLNDARENGQFVIY